METLDAVLVPLPRAVCLPSPATLNAAVPKLQLTEEEAQQLSIRRELAFERAKNNHNNCAAILLGSLETQAIELIPAHEETKIKQREEELRKQIQAVKMENCALETKLAQSAEATTQRLMKEGWEALSCFAMIKEESMQENTQIAPEKVLTML
ncbi:hypothetical protein THRCLA_23277 [Thraustotheca clavata]|uniref:Uncharacterized protein n=1 Tax=Thraustotheca clavata TaxID=74557 RepID=A0A1V9Y841_9STRA|nr:hypothetical protein THRCLA_23277 [Thraustotheca clavata]